MRLRGPGSIRSRLFAILVFALGGVVALGAAGWFLGVHPALRRNLAESQRQVAWRAADQIEDYLEAQVRALRTAVEIGRLWELNRDRQKEALYRLLKLAPSVLEVSLADAGGREVVRLSRTRVYTEADLAPVDAQEWFRAALRGQVYLGPVYHDRTAEPLLRVAVPVRFTSAEGRGAVAATVSLKTLWNAIAHIPIGRAGHAFVVDRRGNLIAHRNSSKVLLGRNVAHLATVRESLGSAGPDPAPGRIVPGEAGGMVVSTFARVPGPGWTVIVEEPVGTALAEVRRLELLALLLTLGAVGGAFALSYRISQRLVRPLRELAAGAARLSEGDLAHRLTIRTGDEVEVLAERFNHMADRLQASHRDLERKVAEKTRDLSALYALTAPLGRAGDLKGVLDDAVAKILEVTGAEAASVRFLDEEGERFLLASYRGFPEAYVQAVSPTSHQNPAAGEVLRTSQPVFAEELREHPLFRQGPLGRHGFRSAAYLPLVASGKVTGIMTLASREPGRLGARQGELLAAIAHQISIAVENARLYAQVRRQSQDLERKVAERTRELEAASRAKSEFLANMSHELRTPLNAIIGFADLLQAQAFGPLTPKQARYVQNIQTGGVHLLNLVNDILDLARIEAGRLELHPEPTPLEAVAAEALDVIRPAAGQKRLTLTCDLPPHLPAVYADPLRLRQILTNLLSNAVKFTGPGGRVTLRARRAMARANGDGGWVEIQVEDTGIGIAPEDLPRLFRQFEQLDGGMAKEHQGTGLGLALTRRLVEMHGGTVTAHSAGKGKGSTFTVRLPLDFRRACPAVLVVDDDPRVRDALVGAMLAWGWRAAGGASLAEARAAMARSTPDLVILDIALPDGSGVDFIRELRRGAAGGPAILMYTGMSAQEAMEAREAGADDTLVKPAPLDMIRQRAQALLARAGRRDLAAPRGPSPVAPGG